MANQKSSIIRRSLIGLAWGVTLIALVYGIIDWRGRRAWESYRTDYEAHIASLDFKTYIPKDIPDADNFAAIPLIRSWLDQSAQTNQLFDKDHVGRVVPSNGISLLCVRGGDHPHFCDLVAWRDVFAAEDQVVGQVTNRVLSGQFDARSRAQAAPVVLQALQDDEDLFNQLRQASSRARARYPIDYILDDPWAIRLPHLSKIKQSCMRLEVKACAELALNQSTNALNDIRLELYLADSLKDEPILISWLIRAVCVRIASDAVWEGLAEHRWSDAQLQELQSRFEQYDFIPGLETSLHAERSAGVLTADLLKKRDVPFLSLLTDRAIPSAFLTRLAPSGWFDQEKLQYCRLFDLQFEGAWDHAARTFSPSQINSNSLALQASISSDFEVVSRHRIIAQMLLPALGKVAFRAATAQTATDEAAIACALERYRLANGQFPEALQALSPKYMASLPNDVVTGQPYQYLRTADGQFTLNSIGADDMDSGANLGNNVLSQFRRWFAVKKGDWEWSYPQQSKD